MKLVGDDQVMIFVILKGFSVNSDVDEAKERRTSCRSKEGYHEGL